MGVDGLDPARRALARGDDSAALELLLACWRIRPATELGEAIERLVARRHEAPFVGTLEGWLTAAGSAANDLARGPLLAAIAGRTMAETQTMLEHSVRWRDARLTPVIRELLEKLPWTGKRSRDGWRRIFAAIVQHRDPRLIELSQRLPPTWTIGAEMQRFLTKELDAAVRDLVPESWPEAASVIAVDEVPAAATTPRTEAELLAGVYDAPDADGPRSVLADWLLERGDPRGELIALQLRGESGDKLLAKHRKRWIGPIEPVVRDVVFRRGFPAAATVKFRHQRDVDQHGHHAAWATIEDLGWTYSQARDDRLAWSRAVTAEMINLRRVRNPSLAHLLAATRPWRIERLEITLGEAGELRQILGQPLLPDLRELYLIGARPSWLANLAACPPHLEILHDLRGNDREAYVSHVEASPAESLTLVGSSRARFTRDDNGKLTRLVIALPIDVPSLDIPPRTAIESVNTALKRFGFRSMSHVDVTIGVRGQATSIAHLVEQARRVSRDQSP